MWFAMTMIHLSVLGQVSDHPTPPVIVDDSNVADMKVAEAAYLARLSPAVNPELLPPAVRSVITSRRAYKTAEFRWTLTYFTDADYGLTERVTTRAEGDTVWETNQGDKNGYHDTTYTMGDTPASKLEMAGPKQRLLSSGQLWRFDAWRGEPGLGGSVNPVEHVGFYFPFDFAYAGLAPTWESDLCANTLCLPTDFVKRLKDMRFRSSSRNGNTEVVVGSSDKYQIEWHLDHRQGGAPVFAAFYVNDVLRLSSVTDYQELDGRRVPRSITFFRGDNPEPHRRIDVQAASFDQPEQQKDISPADLGLLVGSQITIPEAPFMMVWDGGELVTFEEFRELRYVYGLDQDPRIRELDAHGWAKATKRPVEEYGQWLEGKRAAERKRYFKQYGEEPWLRKPGKEKDEWDVYVEKFVKEHQFGKELKKVAKHVLESAKKIRDRNIRAIKRDVNQARKDGQYRRADALADKRNRVKEHIFKRMLVRGMHRLAKKAKRKSG